MRYLGLAVLTLAGLSGCGGSGGESGAEALASPSPDYLAMASGNRWTYALTYLDAPNALPDYDLTTIEGPVTLGDIQVLRRKTYAQNSPSYVTSYFVQTGTLLEQHVDKELNPGSPTPDKWTLLRLPLISGDAYTAYDYTNLSVPDSLDWDGLNESYSIRRHVAVGSTESVTVPAGTFNNALKITVTARYFMAYSAGGTFEINDIIDEWYAPGTGLIKQRATTTLSDTVLFGPVQTRTERVLTGSRIGGISSDTTPPTLTETWPVHNATASDVYTVSLMFSEHMDPGSFSSATFTVKDVDGNIVPGSYALTDLHFEGGLPVGTYTAHVEGVTDALGNQLVVPYTWSFTVVPNPCYGTAMFC